MVAGGRARRVCRSVKRWMANIFFRVQETESVQDFGGVHAVPALPVLSVMMADRLTQPRACRTLLGRSRYARNVRAAWPASARGRGTPPSGRAAAPHRSQEVQERRKTVVVPTKIANAHGHRTPAPRRGPLEEPSVHKARGPPPTAARPSKRRRRSFTLGRSLPVPPQK